MHRGWRTRKPTAQISKSLAALLPLCLLVAGCGHRKARVPVPPPPPGVTQLGPHGNVLSSEIGIASWYRAADGQHANGKDYGRNAMTAAHRTLPFGTRIRVTDLSTHRSAIVTITDRGPFVSRRILDLSRAAAVKIGMYRAGVARVRIDVLNVPHAAQGTEGHWCVQAGAFEHSGTAKKLKKHLQHQYPRARVIEFKGETGYWVRIRPDGGSLQDAEQVQARLRLHEGTAYIMRLN